MILTVGVLAFAACQKSEIVPANNAAQVGTANTENINGRAPAAPKWASATIKGGVLEAAKFRMGIDFGTPWGSGCYLLGLCRITISFQPVSGVFYNTGYAESAFGTDKKLYVAFDSKTFDDKTYKEQFGNGVFELPEDKVVPGSDLKKAGYTKITDDYRIAAGKYPVTKVDEFLVVQF